MAVIFDQAGTVGSVGSSSTVSCTDDATAGATVLAWVYWASSTNSGSVTATYAGAEMTQVGSTITSGAGATGFYQFLALFEITAPGGGGTVTATASIAAAKINTISYTGVGSVGPLSGAGSIGSSTPAISGVASATGHLVSNAGVQFDNSATFNSYTGTQRFFNNTGAFLAPMLFGDTAGASTVSFSMNSSAAAYWLMGAVDLVPQATTTVAPATATVAVSGGTPDVIAPSGPKSVSPASASITVKGDYQGPLAPVINKLAAGQSAQIQIIGDSTAFGSYDTGFNNGTTPWTPGTLCGWPGRMALALGTYFNANVQVHVWNYPTNTAYASATSLHSGTGGATLTVWLGGWPGGVMANYQSSIAAMLPASNVDVVIINSGFNELVASTAASQLLTFIGDVQSTYCPGAPIIVTTENATTITEESGHAIPFAAIFAAMIDALISTDPAQPLVPALQSSNTVAGVWVLDTQQAGQNASSLYTDGLHPIAPGYAEQAQFMLNHLTADLPGLIEDSGLFIPTGGEAVVTGGTPGVSIANDNVVDSPSPARVTVTTGRPSIGVFGPVSVSPPTATVRATGDVPTIYNQSSSPYFTVDGYFLADPAGDYSAGQLGAYVTFAPRVPAGFASFMAALGLEGATGPTVGHLVSQSTADGIVWQLCTAGGSPGVPLLANSVEIANFLSEEGFPGGQLIYDVYVGPIDLAGANRVPRDFFLFAPGGGTVAGVSSNDAAAWGNTIVY